MNRSNAPVPPPYQGGGQGEVAPDRTACAASDRLHSLDALRAWALLACVAFHAAFSYADLPLVDVPWPARAAEPSRLVSLVLWWLRGFQLPLFFLLGGFFAAQLCVSRGPRAFVRHRLRRVALPYVVFAIVLLPLTFYVFAAGWWLAGDCTWNEIRRVKFAPAIQAQLYGSAHLWFLGDLVLYCLLLSALKSPLAPRFQRGVRASGWVLLTGLVLWIDATCVIGHRNTFLPDPARFFYYIAFFAAGVTLYARADRLALLARWWPACLVVSLPFFAGAEALLRAERTGTLPAAGGVLFALSWSLFAWLSVAGFVGLAQRLFARPHARIRELADASYWTYLVHFPLVAALQILLTPVPFAATGKFALVTACTLALCLSSYERWVRHSFIGVLLNGRRPGGTNHDVSAAAA
jgi:peptidoglycan/LPS O-acetylase OafA/YrhL